MIDCMTGLGFIFGGMIGAITGALLAFLFIVVMGRLGELAARVLSPSPKR